MKKVFLYIISFLMMIFPNSVSLQGSYQGMMYPGRATVTRNIVEAVKERDAEAIENMLSEYTKSKSDGDDVSLKVQEVLAFIEGEIVKGDWDIGTYDSFKKDYDEYLSSEGWIIKLETTKAVYYLNISWIRVDTNMPEKVGMEGMTLYDSERNLLAGIY